MSLPTSSGPPYLPSEFPRAKVSWASLTVENPSFPPDTHCSSIDRIIRVCVGAGFTVLAGIPIEAPSVAAERINPITACSLVA